MDHTDQTALLLTRLRAGQQLGMEQDEQGAFLPDDPKRHKKKKETLLPYKSALKELRVYLPDPRYQTKLSTLIVTRGTVTATNRGSRQELQLATESKNLNPLIAALKISELGWQKRWLLVKEEPRCNEHEHLLALVLQELYGGLAATYPVKSWPLEVHKEARV